jgi:hypothetical protein
MEWVIGSFRYMGRLWKTRAERVGSERPGPMAYATKETERWNRWAEISKVEFEKVTGMQDM